MVFGFYILQIECLFCTMQIISVILDVVKMVIL